ncbi:TetR family transcriptional regulator [Curtobacterium flaccumfaciens]|nr:TetR family transcriptional regulator [Curtobacterium flaccumfaciens]
MSTRTEPTQERALQTRAAVVRGAAKVFERRGYAGASLDQIADEAGVTRGAMYFHFRSKEEIADAVIVEQHRVARVDAEVAIVKASSAFEAMIRMCTGLARQLVSDGVVSAGIRLTTDGSASSLSNVAPYRDWMATFREPDRLGRGAGRSAARHRSRTACPFRRSGVHRGAVGVRHPARSAGPVRARS